MVTNCTVSVKDSLNKSYADYVRKRTEARRKAAHSKRYGEYIGHPVFSGGNESGADSGKRTIDQPN
ncbi:hypothetical protein C8R32_101244 [Nitrosospira sp. Nsp5]|uniref:Uncharacterized protein n=1 Tax=Nitrosospira multiformis TaxID=1231 RepID=A0ABY0TFX1_9PROT|nr:hypothetical protein C8R32_101244 [Nitrosospira sp. Nsp5]SDQ76990.1 hypothetical protein SAMN05216402_2216 [Nitrosospira multiformis]